MENKPYTEPKMEVMMFEITDAITVSNGGIELPDDDWE